MYNSGTKTSNIKKELHIVRILSKINWKQISFISCQRFAGVPAVVKISIAPDSKTFFIWFLFTKINICPCSAKTYNLPCSNSIKIYTHFTLKPLTIPAGMKSVFIRDWGMISMSIQLQHYEILKCDIWAINLFASFYGIWEAEFLQTLYFFHSLFLYFFHPL